MIVKSNKEVWKKEQNDRNNLRVFNRGLLGKLGVLGRPNLAAGSHVPQARRQLIDS